MKTTHQLLTSIVLLFSLAFAAHAGTVEISKQAQLFQTDAAPSETPKDGEKKKKEEEPDC